MGSAYRVDLRLLVFMFLHLRYILILVFSVRVYPDIAGAGVSKRGFKLAFNGLMIGWRCYASDVFVIMIEIIKLPSLE